MARPAADPVQLRERILDAAEQLLGRFGYRKMTIEDLAAAAGIAKGSIYLHFSSKEEIALARIDRVIGELVVKLEEIAESDSPAPERLRSMLITRVLFRLDRVTSYRDSIDELVAAIRPHLVAARRDHHRKEAKVFAAVIRDGIRRHQVRACAAQRTAEAFVLATNALLPGDLRPHEINEKEIRAKVSTIAGLLIEGVLVR